MNRYEVLVILPESLTEDEVEKGLDALCKEIKGIGGKSTRPTRMGRRPFARKIQKQSAGEYALLHMTLDPSKVAVLLENQRHNELIMRIQVSRLGETAPEEPSAPEVVAEAAAE